MEIDKSETEELKDVTKIDNSKLEELMKQELTLEMQNEFLEIFKDSQLFMPVRFSDNMFEGIENAKEGDVLETTGQSGFSINYLTDHDGNRAVPLFTSSEVMESVGARTSAMVIFMSDLAGMLKQTDNYAVIAINPFTEFDLNMPIEAFYNLFPDVEGKPEKLRNLMALEKLNSEESELLKEELFNALFIVPCVNADDGTNFVLIWDNDNKPHLPLFTEAEEFNKIFEDYSEDVFPQAYYLKDLLSVAKEDLVINPASESFVLNEEVLKNIQ